MNCPACNGKIGYSGGENTKDYHCLNYVGCQGAIEINRYTHVSVKPDWWFAERYNLPFKYDNKWYWVEGPRAWKTPNLTLLKTSEIITSPISNLSYEYESMVWSIPYMALPVNEDFNREFDILVSKFSRYLDKLVVLK